jgi:hypothetical protein
MPTAGRNDPCPCGSGKKFKRCCLDKDQAAALAPLLARRAAQEAAAVKWQAQRREHAVHLRCQRRRQFRRNRAVWKSLLSPAATVALKSLSSLSQRQPPEEATKKNHKSI